MKKVEDLFKARASNPLDIAMLYDGRVGFTIPEYQRQYDWSEENIKRLFCDTLNGFQRLSESGNDNIFTFLGSLILVEEKTREENFSGQSVAIVDGQQRLTTLTLFACALCEALRGYLPELDSLANDSNIKRWLEKEIEERLYKLYRCAIGSQNVTPTQTFPFARIVRHGDARAKSKPDSEYISPVGKFLEGFAEYFENEDVVEYVPPALGGGTDAGKLANNFQIIRKLLSNLNCTVWYEDTECEQFDIEWTRRGQCRDLFERLPDFIKDEGERNKAIEEIIKGSARHELFRTLMFSAYFCRYIVLTTVITEDETAAFDIFDALNTTGEPLTALETLKPRVIQFESKKSGYEGSESELSFKKISENLDERFPETSRKQTETKELIVTFALYLEGQKLPKDLAAQRNFLRRSYDGATIGGTISAQKYVEALAKAAEFRRFYWESGGIEELAKFHNHATVDEVQLLTSLTSDMKTSLALPILLRYWQPDLKQENDKENRFVQALKAIIAFVVIRRAATGGTAGIDSDFRAIMAPCEGRGASRKFGLYAGIDNKNPVMSPDGLKQALKTLLQHKLRTLDKSRWIETVVANPLYQQSKGLARFMILSAGHQAIPSTNEPGIWEKPERISKHTNDFCNYRTWKNSCYATVEHIAPDTVPVHGWETDLYKDNILRHSLGNLILLPEKENAAISSGSWTKKRIFYLALTETSPEQQSKRFEEAKSAGFSLSNKTKKLLEDGYRFWTLCVMWMNGIERL